MRASRYNSLPQLAAVMIGFVLTTLLLESEALLLWAQRLEVGPAAAVAIQATAALDHVLQPLHADAVRRNALASLDRLGWSDDPARLLAAQRSLRAGMSANTLTCAVKPLVPDLPLAARSLATIPLPSSTPASTPLPPLGPVHDGQPRVVALAGDSMMAVGLSDILLRQTAADPNVRVIKAFRSGTGLARPDVFDWMQEYPAMIGSDRPDAVIVAIGANDGQGFVQDGKVLPFASDAWVEVYRQRIAAFLAMLTQDGASVVWVGLPPMKSAQYNEKAALINRIAYSVVSKTPHATWWNPVPYIADQAGAYREFAAMPDGKTTRLRSPDGIHLSDEGAALLAPPLIGWLNAPPPLNTAQAAPPTTPKAKSAKGRPARRMVTAGRRRVPA
jgi:lysophospholipase L1-like esterase